MAGETNITVVGNLTAKPELRTTNAGRQYARFTIASTPRRFDRATGQWTNGTALFLNCVAWGEVAENLSTSLDKGLSVIAQGDLSQDNYQAQDGSNRTSYSLNVTDIGPNLRWGTAQFTRTQSTGGSGGYSSAATPATTSSAGGNTGAPWEAPLSDPADFNQSVSVATDDPAAVPF
jgi:single-strand DNA-binding protein